MDASKIMEYIKKTHREVNAINDITFSNETDWSVILEVEGYPKKFDFEKKQFVQLENEVMAGNKDFFCCYSSMVDGTVPIIETIINFKTAYKDHYFNFYFQQDVFSDFNSWELQLGPVDLKKLQNLHLHDITKTYLNMLINWFKQEPQHRLRCLLAKDYLVLMDELAEYIG
jgi:hypothetical protein